MVKTCTRCKESRPLEQFSVRQASPDGLAYVCRSCDRINKRTRYLNNPSPAIARATKWRLANPERRKEIRQASQKRRYEAGRATRDAARVERADISRFRNRVRKLADQGWAKAKCLGVTRERVQYLNVIQRCGWMCYLCYEAVDEASIGFDHIVPMSRGGAHVESNIAVAHRSCNIRKSAKLIGEFREWQRKRKAA